MVVANFLPCGRCSFFLAGYRVIHGVEHLEAAARESDEGWVQLNWNEEVRRLVQQSYGVRLDVDAFHFDSRCPECQRRFIYHEGELDATSASFQVELK